MMNIEEMAIEEETRLLGVTQKKAEELKISDYLAKSLVEDCVTLIADSETKGLVYNIGKHTKPISIKPGNIFLDIKKSLTLALELGIGVSKPDDTLSLIQLVGFLTLTIYRASKRELPLGSSEVIIVLHKNNCYDNEIEENILKEKVDDFVKENKLQDISENQFFKVINFLLRYNIISMENNKIRLEEKVYGKDFTSLY